MYWWRIIFYSELVIKTRHRENLLRAELSKFTIHSKQIEQNELIFCLCSDLKQKEKQKSLVCP